MGLQFESVWGQHRTRIVIGGAALACLVVWRVMWATARSFVSFSEATAELGFLAASASALALVAVFLRWRVRADPQVVYQLALRRLGRSPAVHEALGLPVAGSHVRAFVMTGGHPKLKRWWQPGWRSHRCHMVFPVAGTEHRGLVSVECKKRRGRYVFKALALDVPSAAGTERRLFLEGTPAMFNRGGVLGELRDPFLQVLSLDRAYDDEDDADDEAEEEERLEEEHRRQLEAAHEGRPVYFSDWAALWAREAAAWLTGEHYKPGGAAAPGASGGGAAARK